MSNVTRSRSKGEGNGGRANKKVPERKPRPAKKSSRGLSPAGTKIVAAFEEAIEAMRSGEPLEKRFTVRTYNRNFAPPAYGPHDVRRVRGILGMSQAVFARFLGVGANTVRSWEQGTRPASTIARRFMMEIEENPEYWRGRVAHGIAVVDPKGSTG
jgi:putative transcriptional regulator